MVILVLVWRKSIHFWRRYALEKTIYIFVPSDLDRWPLDLKFAPLVNLAQSYVSTKLEVSKAFLFWENRRHGTDGRTDVTLNAVP